MIAFLLDWAHKSTKKILGCEKWVNIYQISLMCFGRKFMKNVNAFVRIESHARCLKRLKKEKE